jgi:DnaK suppressor protein
MNMNKTNINGCKQILEAKRRELLSIRHQAEGIAVERVPDSVEELTMLVQRQMAVDVLNLKATVLCQVTAALERIAGGKYGVCQACRKAISPKRLAALPWAALCLECQQTAENRQDMEARASMGQRLEDSGNSDVDRLAGSVSGRQRRFRRQVIPRAATNGAAIKSHAGL